MCAQATTPLFPEKQQGPGNSNGTQYQFYQIQTLMEE